MLHPNALTHLVPEFNEVLSGPPNDCARACPSTCCVGSNPTQMTKDAQSSQLRPITVQMNVNQHGRLLNPSQ